MQHQVNQMPPKGFDTTALLKHMVIVSFKGTLVSPNNNACLC